MAKNEIRVKLELNQAWVKKMTEAFELANKAFIAFNEAAKNIPMVKPPKKTRRSP